MKKQVSLYASKAHMIALLAASIVASGFDIAYEIASAVSAAKCGGIIDFVSIMIIVIEFALIAGAVVLLALNPKNRGRAVLMAGSIYIIAKEFLALIVAIYLMVISRGNESYQYQMAGYTQDIIYAAVLMIAGAVSLAFMDVKPFVSISVSFAVFGWLFVSKAIVIFDSKYLLSSFYRFFSSLVALMFIVILGVALKHLYNDKKEEPINS